MRRKAAVTVRRERLAALLPRLAPLLVVFVVGGVFGFLYEEVFYYIDLGYFVKRGTTFGPWIPIYGWGALLIVLTTDRLRKHPLAVFLISALVCGLLELGTGVVLHRVFGLRLWDYSTELWNWGNLGGYICARSLLVFGAAALLLQYAVYPLILRLQARCRPKTFLLASAVPAALFLADMALYRILPL